MIPDTDAVQMRLADMLMDLDRSIAMVRGERHGPKEEQYAADAGANLCDADRVEATLAALHGQRTEVLAALRRAEAGAYGRCVDCSGRVPEGRLEARPEAARCVSCQTKRDRRRR